MMSVSGCTYMKMGESTLKYDTLNAAGIFREPVYDKEHNKVLGCVRYSNAAQVDRGFRIVRAMAVLMAICLSVIFLLITPTILFITNNGKRVIFYSVSRALIIPALVFNCIMFILFGREECRAAGTQCSPGLSGIVAILNTFIIFILAVLLFVTPVPSHPEIVPSPEDPTPPRQLSSNKKNGRVDQLQQTKDIENTDITNVVIPELGKADKEVDLRIRRVPESGGLKISQRLIHVDGTKTVTSYFVKTIKKDSSAKTSKRRGGEDDHVLGYF